MTATTRQTGLAEALMGLSHLVAHVFSEVSRGRDLTPQQAQLLCTLIGGPVPNRAPAANSNAAPVGVTDSMACSQVCCVEA